jgi:hypothetical protein
MTAASASLELTETFTWKQTDKQTNKKKRHINILKMEGTKRENG